MNEHKTVKILIADDDLNFLKIAEQKLTQRGFYVLVSTLAEAVSILKKETIDLVFIDYAKLKTDAAGLMNVVDSIENKPSVQYLGNFIEREDTHQLYI